MMGEWISIEQQLPIPGQTVIVWTYIGDLWQVQFGYLSRNASLTDDHKPIFRWESQQCIRDVSHWMPLPAPPTS